MSEIVSRAEIALRKELERQAADGEIFYRDEDGIIDGRPDRALLVRAVIAAMREPTEAMVETAFEYVGFSPQSLREKHQEMADDWRAMIDAVLAD